MNDTSKVAFITGGAKRIGAVLVRTLHQQGYRIGLHYRHSSQEAQALATELNQSRPQSVQLFHADAADLDALHNFPTQIEHHFGRLDLLINNASSFYPTPLGNASLVDWNALVDSNVKMAFFLSQACAPLLQTYHGNIINITDIHATQVLKNYPIYSLAKAALKALTESLALELSPNIRVNAIAPGWVLFNPELDHVTSELDYQRRLAKIPLQRIGSPAAIADAMLYLSNADYVTGHTLQVDGGRHLV